MVKAIASNYHTVVSIAITFACAGSNPVADGSFLDFCYPRQIIATFYLILTRKVINCWYFHSNGLSSSFTCFCDVSVLLSNIDYSVIYNIYAGLTAPMHPPHATAMIFHFQFNIHKNCAYSSHIRGTHLM